MLLAAAPAAVLAQPAAAQGPGCTAPANEIVAENCLPGAPESEWDVSGSGDPNIQGFATDISLEQGQTVQFKINSVTSLYRLDIYRMGWYQGSGARRVATVRPLGASPQQPACQEQSATGLVDCANWSVTAAWAVPPNAVSGIYFARLVREDGPAGSSHVVFVVRDDDGASELLFQTSDTTWQAYNRFGGNSLYTGSPSGRAYKVSYNRPFSTREYASEDWVFNAEYPMVRWMERNGYDVSYSTGVDSDRRGAELLEHETFLSVGHDEYWSGEQRTNVESARAAGVNLAFFSGNEVFWKTRWEDGHRTLVSYKDTHEDDNVDPSGAWTGTWRDSRSFNPEGSRPENALTGTIFTVNCCAVDLQVPSTDGRMRLWRNTSLANLGPGATATLGQDTVGYEWDEDLDNGARPPGLVRMSSTTASGVQKLQDQGSSYASGTATHSLTLYRQPNGDGPDSIVFGAGTVQWSWGLDAQHDRGNAPADVRMQQATANLLADMDAQPGTLQGGLTPALESADCTPPTSAPSSASVSVSAGVAVSVGGSATDAGGRVGGVEVSVNGAAWHPATGRESWSYGFTPGASGTATIRSRAVDDSGNLEGIEACRGEPAGGEPAGGEPGLPGGGAPPAGGVSPGTAAPPHDRIAPRMAVGPRTARVSRRGRVQLRVGCPRRESTCRVDLRLRWGDTTVARASFRVASGKTRVLSLRLKPSLRRRLAKSGALRVSVTGAARDAAGNRAPIAARLRLLAPSRR